MRLPQSLAASEDDPSSPYIPASTIPRKALESGVACDVQLAQLNEMENREALTANRPRVQASVCSTGCWLKIRDRTAIAIAKSKAGPAMSAEKRWSRSIKNECWSAHAGFGLPDRQRRKVGRSTGWTGFHWRPSSLASGFVIFRMELRRHWRVKAAASGTLMFRCLFG